MYLDAQGNVIENASLVGYKAIGVPGSVAGLAYAQKKYGKLTLAQVMAPAIKLARDGFTLAWEDARICGTTISRSSPNRSAFFSATGTTTSRARCFASRNWRGRWSGSPKDPDDFYHGAMARELAAEHSEGRRADHRRRSGPVRSEGARADSRDLSRVRRHQRAAAFLGRELR